MKCAEKGCYEHVSVLETRKGAEGTTRRRYICGAGHRFSTLEMHDEAVKRLTKAERLLHEVGSLLNSNRG